MVEKLQHFQFEVIYRKGQSHKNADGLSRRRYESSGCKYCSKIEQKEIQAQSVTVGQIILPEKNLEDWRKEQREKFSFNENSSWNGNRSNLNALHVQITELELFLPEFIFLIGML